MTCHGIIVDGNYKVGNDNAGKIQVLNNDYHPIMKYWYKGNEISIAANYLLSIRDKAKCGEAFATAVHELGHLFCHHLIPVPTKAWDVRYLDHTAEEFEAEAVSFIVCRRLGIETPSAEYLSGYYARNNEVPNISVETVFTASNTILTMIKGIKLKEGILYKYDKNFKIYIDSLE